MRCGRRGSLTITRYFTPPFANTTPDVTSFDEAVRMFETTFDEAVRIRMRSDAPFGAYLSGGIDSSAVVATMVRHSAGRCAPSRSASARRNIPSSTMPASSPSSSAPIIRNWSSSPTPSWTTGETAVLRRGAPVSEASDIPIFMLSKLASQSVKMVLTGEGSDELMGGYPKHRAEPWVSLYQRLMPEVLHEQLVSPLVRALPYGMRRVKVLAMAAGERDLVNRMRVWFGGISVKEREAIMGREASLTPPDPYPFSPNLSSLRQALFFDQTSWLPDNLLERGDRMMMAGSIEGRMPFMDVALAGVVARFPDRFLIGAKRREGRVAGKHGEAPATQHPTPKKGRIPRAVRPMGEGTLSRIRPRHA